jgi:hypothetical protein
VFAHFLLMQRHLRQSGRERISMKTMKPPTSI